MIGVYLMKKVLFVLVMVVCLTMICFTASADIEVYRKDQYEEAYNYITSRYQCTDCVLRAADDINESNLAYCFSVINLTSCGYESYPITVRMEKGKLAYYRGTEKGHAWTPWQIDWNLDGEWVYQDDKSNYKVEIESIPGESSRYRIKYKFIDNERSYKNKDFEEKFFSQRGTEGSFDGLISAYAVPTTLNNGQTVTGLWSFGHELTRVKGGKDGFPSQQIPAENIVFKKLEIQGNYKPDVQLTYEQLLAEGTNLCTGRNPWYIAGTNCSFEILSLEPDPYWDDALLLTYHLKTDDYDYGYESALVPKDACIDFFLGSMDEQSLLIGCIKIFSNKIEIELDVGTVSTVNQNKLVFNQRY